MGLYDVPGLERGRLQFNTQFGNVSKVDPDLPISHQNKIKNWKAVLEDIRTGRTLSWFSGEEFSTRLPESTLIL